MKRVVKILCIVMSSFIGLLMIGFVILWINSPGKLESLKDKDGKEIAGSCVEKSWIAIGGVRQGFFIRSENPENPVLLFLHGGPGSPELPLSIPYESSERLEKYFTVCYWEQRGAGMSYSKLLDTTDITIEQMVEDTRQITEYLQQRFNKEKIYLIGHSWGTYLGMKTIEKYPDHYLAYIGIGQISDQRESEKLAYDYMLQHATEINDTKALEQLNRHDRNASAFPAFDYMPFRSLLMNKYGIGILHQGFPMMRIVKYLMSFKGYTLS